MILLTQSKSSFHKQRIGQQARRCFLHYLRRTKNRDRGQRCARLGQTISASRARRPTRSKMGSQWIPLGPPKRGLRVARRCHQPMERKGNRQEQQRGSRKNKVHARVSSRAEPRRAEVRVSVTRQKATLIKHRLVFQTAGLPPRNGRIILATIGSIMNSKAALTNSVIE